MADYRVNLDIFAGPLDLLLYLVRKEEVDIYDIPIARITDQYISYIELLKSLDIDLAGDFLVMAATLMQIKSAMLLPQAEPDSVSGDDDLSDPRTELIRQLLEYKKFKDAANLLNASADDHNRRFARPDSIIEMLKREPAYDKNGLFNEGAYSDIEPEVDLEQVSIWDLLEAFDTVCKSIGTVPDISHITDDTPIDLYQIEILHRLQTEGPLTFERIFETKSTRVVLVGLFLALLELIRGKLIWAEQADSSAIYIRPLTDESPEKAVQNAIINAEAEYDRSSQTQQQEQSQLPIPIAELPAEGESEVKIDISQDEQVPVPIAEYSIKKSHAALPQEQQISTSEDIEQQPDD